MNWRVFYLMFITTLNAMAQSPQGFFLNDFSERTAAIPDFTEMVKPAKSSTTVITVDVGNVITPVSKYVFGNNANVYMTQMTDQPVLLTYINDLSPNLIRFPGGNISSVYLWNSEVGHPPADAPAKLPDADGKMNDAGYWYGKNEDSWTLSVDNYYKTLEMTGSTGMITINYGYARYSTAPDPVAAAAHLAAEWVRYDNGKTRYWEIGNESNGTWQAGYRINTSTNKDGQPEIITGALYGKHFLVFADSMRKAADEIGAEIYIGAQLLAEEPASWATPTDKSWNKGIFEHAGDDPDFYIIHSYYTPYHTDASPEEILTTATTVTAELYDYVNKAIEAAGLSPKPLALTEWNIFSEGSMQQVSYVNGMHASLVLGELIKNQYGMAARWDLANSWNNGNDHGMFSKGDEPDDVPLWNPRAVFYYMYYFQRYFGDHMISAAVNGSEDIIAFASKYSSGETAVVVVNKETESEIVSVDVQNYGYGDRYYIHSLTGGTDNGEFSLKTFVNGEGPDYASGGPLNYKNIPAKSARIGAGIKFSMDPMSVNYILIEHGDNVINASPPVRKSDIKIFPNPSNGELVIELPYAGFTKLKITDMTGATVLHKPITPESLKIVLKLTLKKGNYILSASRNGKTITSKVIIE